MRSIHVTDSWTISVRRYLLFSLMGHSAWEALQLPLYTIWTTGTAREQVFAVAHCTVGDVMIAASCLFAAWLMSGRPGWPRVAFGRVAATAIVLGVCYTAFSEWLNVAIRGAWSYSSWMPIVRLGTFSIGLSPLMQWIIIPALVFLAVRTAKPDA